MLSISLYWMAADEPKGVGLSEREPQKLLLLFGARSLTTQRVREKSLLFVLSRASRPRTSSPFGRARRLRNESEIMKMTQAQWRCWNFTLNSVRPRWNSTLTRKEKSNKIHRIYIWKWRTQCDWCLCFGCLGCARRPLSTTTTTTMWPFWWLAFLSFGLPPPDRRIQIEIKTRAFIRSYTTKRIIRLGSVLKRVWLTLCPTIHLCLLRSLVTAVRTGRKNNIFALSVLPRRLVDIRGKFSLDARRGRRHNDRSLADKFGVRDGISSIPPIRHYAFAGCSQSSFCKMKGCLLHHVLVYSCHRYLCIMPAALSLQIFFRV